MRLTRMMGILGVAGALAAATPALASASETVKLGSAAPPSEPFTSIPCGVAPEPVVIGEYTSAASTPFTVPTGGGSIESWSTSTVQGEPGAPIALLVLRPVGSEFEVVGMDEKKLPSPLPAGEVATFPLASPISVEGGDQLALYAPPGSAATCYFDGSGVPEADSLFAAESTTPPVPGALLKPVGTPSPGRYVLNVEAIMSVSGEASGEADLAVSTGASSGTMAGGLGALYSTVTNDGPGASGATFTDVVPAGLTVQRAASGSGECTISGQTVSCHIPDLHKGQSAPVVVTYVASAAGGYTNVVHVISSGHDPNLANNTAQATVNVAAPPSASPQPGSTPAPAPAAQKMCVVPNLRNVPLGAAKRILKLLGCEIGRVKSLHARRVAKGRLIVTGPGEGTYPVSRHISLVVSLGRYKHAKRSSTKHSHSKRQKG